MNSQNQNPNQGQNQKSQETNRPEEVRKQGQGQQELSQEDQKEVEGGSGLLSGGNDLTGILQGGIGISNSSSGSHNGESYTSEDSHNIDLGLGGMLDNTNY